MTSSKKAGYTNRNPTAFGQRNDGIRTTTTVSDLPRNAPARGPRRVALGVSPLSDDAPNRGGRRMSQGKDQINFTVETNAKDLAKEKLKHGELSTELRETIHRIAYGEEISKRERLHKRLAERREEKDNLRAQKRELEAELEEVEGDIARIEERLDGMERQEDKYDATLEMLEETLHAGGRVFEEHGQVMKAAKIGGKEPADVVDELQERNPAIPDHAFKQKMHTNKQWDGVRES